MTNFNRPKLKKFSMDDFRMDLQLFGFNDDEEDDVIFVDDEDDQVDVEDQEEETEDQDEEEDEQDLEDEETDQGDNTDGDEEEEDEGDEGDEDEDGPDKKTKALIRYKKEAKEAKKRLEELEQRLQEKEQEKAKEKEIENLIEEGYSEDEATKTVEKNFEIDRLKRKVASYEFSQLEQEFPGISRYQQEIMDLENKLPGLTKREIYLAKFASRSRYDQKTQIEQEMLYKSKEAKRKGKVTSSGKTKKTTNIKLSKQDERAYEHLKKYRPNMTKADYLELLNEDEVL